MVTVWPDSPLNVNGNALLRKDSEFPLFDGQGSERTVTNVSQTVQGSISYDAFGYPNATSGSSTSAYMFGATSGYRSDGDSGLILVGCRYYDPQVGRFVTRDTYLDQHPYLYCNSEPVNRVDPTGHIVIVILLVAVFLIFSQEPAGEPGGGNGGGGNSGGNQGNGGNGNVGGGDNSGGGNSGGYDPLGPNTKAGDSLKSARDYNPFDDVR